MASIKRILYTTLLATISIGANAQNGINSPYSRYGLGMQAERSMGFNKGMGGVAMGFRDGQIINTANPASYSAVDSLTALFDLGLSLYNGNYKMGELQQNAKNSSFDYFAFHFRASKGLGVALGVLPYTNINYSFASPDEPVPGTEQTKSVAFSGDGGLHQIFLGAGWQICKPLSIGFNFSYLYGSYSHTMNDVQTGSNVMNVKRVYSSDISTYMLDLGAQYTLNLNKKDKLTFGANYSLGHDIDDMAFRQTSSYSSSNGTTASTTDSIANAFQLPHSITAGVTYSHGYKWNVGADFELQKWSDVLFPTQIAEGNYTSSKGVLNDRMRISLGASYTPYYLSSNYFNRITYKLGGYYSKSYANADYSGTLSDKPYEFGLSAGVSLPISNRHLWYNSPKLNISVQWVHSNIPYISGGVQNKLTENYLKLCLGLTFSERWFFKWKVQ